MKEYTVSVHLHVRAAQVSRPSGVVRSTRLISIRWRRWLEGEARLTRYSIGAGVSGGSLRLISIRWRRWLDGEARLIR